MTTAASAPAAQSSAAARLWVVAPVDERYRFIGNQIDRRFVGGAQRQRECGAGGNFDIAAVGRGIGRTSSPVKVNLLATMSLVAPPREVSPVAVTAMTPVAAL